MAKAKKAKKDLTPAQEKAAKNMRKAWDLVKSGQEKNITEALRTVWGK